MYTLSENPISWELRRFQGYRLSKPIMEKITHSFFIDDLKCYSKSEDELRKMMSHTKTLMGDAGLEWNVKKTKVLNIKRGVIDTTKDKLILNDDTAVEYLKNEEIYKFLGVPEKDLHDVANLVENLKSNIKKRASVVWSSPLSDYNKVHSTNMFVNACVEYFMWTERINISDLREFDVIIRDIMNIQKAKYKLQINSNLYMPRIMGGRGLRQFETSYKITKIKSVIKILLDNDPKIILVKKFDLLRKQKNRSSFINDATRFAMEDFDVDFKLLDDSFSFTYTNENDDVISITNPVVVDKVLKSKVRKTLQNDLANATWQGVIMKQRLSDKDLILQDCFMWCNKWKNSPVDVINDIMSIYLQVVPILTFKKFRGQVDIVYTDCRLCKTEPESIYHLLSHCEKFARTLYIKRHNKALQYILFHVLLMYKLVDKCIPWFSEVIIKPQYENEDIDMLWDIPEYTGLDNEDEDKLQRPDGKIIFKKKKIIYVLEMSVPWITNRETKLLEKEEKYRNIIRSLKLQHPGYHVEQLTFIIDCLGGYSISLIDNLKKLELSSKVRNSVLLGLQKITVTEARALINQFKVLTSF